MLAGSAAIRWVGGQNNLRVLVEQQRRGWGAAIVGTDPPHSK